MNTPGAIPLPVKPHLLDGGHTPSSDACLICGKPLNPRTAPRVHCVDGTVLLIAPIGQDADEAGDMGYWSVGPDCARLVPANYLLRTRR